jgi:site-specific DNA-methyltransferase (adenine-specific)/modification methylase
MFTLHNGDWKSFDIGAFNAIVTDPPYGIGFASQPTKWQRRAGMKPELWDEQPADISKLLEYEKPTVIFGGNYFQLPLSRCWVVWIKPDAPPSMGNVEMAWTNFDENSRYITQTISATNPERVGHPTQKPLKVMRYIIENFTKEGDTIFDPFMGSGTTGVACIQTGRHFIGCEISAEYFALAEKRVKSAVFSPSFFTPSNNRLHLTGGGLPAIQSSFTAEVFPPAKLPVKSPRR